MEKQLMSYDVAICGGGLAGQTLARQLTLQQPECSVVMIDRVTPPLPEAAFKVGESTVELSGNYLGEKLQLGDYFIARHFKKMGLRYFFNNGAVALEERPEFGLSVFPAVDSYQIDRGRLEEDLRRFNVAAGVQFIEGKRVKDICLASEGQQPHTIFLENMPGSVAHKGGAAAPDTIHARWVIDAMGRRRYLQKKLKLVRETEAKCSAAWFRLEGRVDLCDLVASDSPWQTRVPNRQRYFSTNHLMGNGYWVWLIPLATNYTSVGIVTQESIHPFETFNTYARTQAWLRTHEPQLAEYIQHRTPLDFLCMRRYSYSSHQTFSEQRWACVGDAGVFADPFYSPGINLVGFANSITAEMIRLDFAEQLTAERVNEFNRYYIGMNDTLTTNIQLGYPFFGSAMPMAGKLLWDNSAAWAFNCPQMFNSIYLDPERSAQFRQATARFFSLTQRMQNLFVQWSMKSGGQLTYAFLDYLSLDFLHEWRLRNLRSGKSNAELVADHAYNMQRFEELAQVLFLLAVEDVMPECLARFPEPVWINAWRIGLDPARWESDQLFQPTTIPRDLTPMREQVRSRFYRKNHE